MLDDGNRPWVKALATELGWHYRTRSGGERGKAGNLNSVLGELTEELILVIDADHVVKPKIVKAMTPYFNDPGVALVQTPQEYYTLNSFTHFGIGKKEIFAEENLFYRVVLPARNSQQSAFSCGTGVMYSRKRLVAAGGFWAKSVLEDLPTSVRLIKQGGKTIFHSEILSLGISTETSERYLSQRTRWAVGALEQMWQQSPLSPRNRYRSLGQRLVLTS